jgi:hypothetical protein
MAEVAMVAIQTVDPALVKATALVTVRKVVVLITLVMAMPLAKARKVVVHTFHVMEMRPVTVRKVVVLIISVMVTMVVRGARDRTADDVMEGKNRQTERLVVIGLLVTNARMLCSTSGAISSTIGAMVAIGSHVVTGDRVR